MHLCRKDEILELIDTGRLKVTKEPDDDLVFLDDHRLGLRLDQIHEVLGPIDLGLTTSATLAPFDFARDRLVPGRFYLGISRERVNLGNGYVASIHTRSRYARIGLETLGSSNLVVPGFGTCATSPIVLELTTRLPTGGVNREDCYCFMLIFRLNSPRRTLNDKWYHRRFPLNWINEPKGQREH